VFSRLQSTAKLEPVYLVSQEEGSRGADASAPTLKSQVTGMLNKAKKAAELIVPMLSANNSPRSARSTPGVEAAAPQPQTLSPFNSGSVQAAGSMSTSEGCSSVYSLGCYAQTSCSTPVSAMQVDSEQGQEAQQQQQQQQQPQQGTPSYGSFSAAKKTLGKLFGGGNGNISSGSGQAPASPNGSGLIAAFRAIIPKTSNESTVSMATDNTAPTPQQQPSFAPPPPSPGRKSTLLAICPHLPPSMQRAEWCLDDYVVMDKLYTGYASVGECTGWLAHQMSQKIKPSRPSSFLSSDEST